MEKKISYRYCIVPLCTNTTVSTPEKYFFHVPNDKKLRNKWCKLMRREKVLSTKTSRHCCENHFNIESDTENHMKWKLCGGTLKLKQGAVPTKFESQKMKRTATVSRPGYDKRQRIDFFESLLTKEVRPSVAQKKIEFISFDNQPMELNELNNPLSIDNTHQIVLPATKIKKTSDKKIQVEQQKKNVQTQTIKNRKNVKEALSLELDASFECDKMDCTSDSSSYSDSIERYEVYTDNYTNTRLKIEYHSKLYLGRIREYKLTAPHACVDTKAIDMLDDVVTISCGLVNLQSKLV
ncbi:unnamed protein product [Euphydryas editha]|uniref:THAP-type domain-containing protein n=1 Tax=Euphydryas editha TaxID=104508 RepID=A0AAU9U938_EUPED|nr:unnamed protein product [Euphydryas editha]